MKTKAAFDPAAVPEPKSDAAPFSLVATVVPYVFKYLLGIGKGDNANERIIFVEAKDDDVESIPITWHKPGSSSGEQ